MGSCFSNTSAEQNVLGQTYSRHNVKDEVNINFDNLFTEANDPSPLPDDHPTEAKNRTSTMTDLDDTVESDVDKDICSICYNKIEKNTDKILDCGHKYHETCIETWFKESRTCPICREPCSSDIEMFILRTLTSGSIYLCISYIFIGNEDVDLLELLLAHINETLQDLRELEALTNN